jgi:hypothetical protein
MLTKPRPRADYVDGRMRERGSSGHCSTAVSCTAASFTAVVPNSQASIFDASWRTKILVSKILYWSSRKQNISKGYEYVYELELWFQQFLSLAPDGVDCQISGSVHYKRAEMVSGTQSILWRPHK